MTHASVLAVASGGYSLHVFLRAASHHAMTNFCLALSDLAEAQRPMHVPAPSMLDKRCEL
jgi:hypothetical protein